MKMKIYQGIAVVLLALSTAGYPSKAATEPRGPADHEPQRVFKRSGVLPRPTRPVYHSPPINAFSLSDLQPHKDTQRYTSARVVPSKHQPQKSQQLFTPSIQSQQHQREYLSSGSGEERYFGSEKGGIFSLGSGGNQYSQVGQRYGGQSLGGQNFGSQSLGGQGYGGQSLGSQNLRGQNFGSQSLGGQSYGGQSLGSQSLSGQSYGGQSLGGQNYGGQSLSGQNYGGQSLGGQSYGSQSLGGQNYGGQSLGGQTYGGQSPEKLSAADFAIAAAAFLPTPVPKVPKLLVATHNVKHANIVKTGLYNDVGEDLGHDAHYEFSYDVIHEGDPHHGKGEGQFFGHAEKREGPVTRGRYHVLLPDGRHQKVAYMADHSGYHAQVSYN